jgi:hypothetical protein
VPPLHITNGDCAGDKLRRILPGTVTTTCDVLHEGPAPAVDGDGWYAARGRFLADAYGLTAEEVGRDLARWDRETTAAVSRGDDVVLWFEHDLFDQLLLIRTLDLLNRLKADTTYQPADVVSGVSRTNDPTVVSGVSRTDDPTVVSGFSRTDDPTVVSGFSRTVSLICIDRFPGVDRFIGLGQLSEEQLATLIGSERPVTAEQFAVASEAWRAFRSPDPRELVAITVGLKPDVTCDSPLPFLRDALRRFLAEYPSATNGLTRTEQLALEALDQEPMAAGQLFVATQAREPRPFIGDSTFYDMLRRLASARVPLVSLAAAAAGIDIRQRTVALTDAGRTVAGGKRDHIALNGIDLWRGGVHLAGTDRSPFRWDARSETLIS